MTTPAVKYEVPDDDHDCPWYCHFCPRMNGGVMPFCTGEAVLGGDDDMSHCTCPENADLFEYVRLRPGADEVTVMPG